MEEQGLADFEAGYDDNATQTTTPEPVAVEEAPASKLAQITEEQFQTLLAKSTAIDEIKAENKRQFDSMFGRLGGLQQTINQLQSAGQKVSDKPTNDQVKEALSSPKEWDELKSEYPEWANAVEKFTDHRMSGVDPDSIAKMVEQQLSAKSATDEERIIKTSLNAAFPGWEKELKTPEFAAWREAQSDEIKALGASNDVGDAARMLRLYEKSKDAPIAQPKNTASREKRIAAAVAPRGLGGHQTVNTDDDFESGYNS